MLIRIIQVGIIGFWLATTAKLVQTVWFPEGMSSGPMETREALDRFFGWNDTNDLAIFENGERIGLMTIAGSSGVEEVTGRFTREFSTTGSILSSGAQQLDGMMGSSWRLNIELDEDFEMTRGQLNFRMPSQGVRVSLEIDGDPEVLSAQIEQRGVVIFQTSRPVGGESVATPELPPGVLPLGISVADLREWKPRFEAGRTEIDLAGRKLPVFEVRVLVVGEQGIRVFLSEAGGPLRIETDWGHEAVAEAILPVEG